MKTHGSHGPSGLDVNDWRQIFTCFKEASANIAKVVAKITIRLATEKVSEKSLCFQGCLFNCQGAYVYEDSRVVRDWF